MNTQKTSNGTSARRGMQAPLDRLLDRTVAKDRTGSHGPLSKPLLGVLPISRLIPQDVHSVMDYVDGLSVGSGALMTKDPAARIASLVLGAANIGMSAVTDYRLSAAKLIPVEKHEVADYVWGLTAIAAPFVLGYWKRAPRVALMHVLTGAGAILASMFTDYRGYKRNR